VTKAAKSARVAKAAHRGGAWGRDFSERFRALRAALGALGKPLGVNRFAEKYGIPASQISSYENGTRLPEAKAMREIAKATGVSLDWLLLGDGRLTEPRFRAPEHQDGPRSFSLVELHAMMRIYFGNEIGALFGIDPERLQLDAAALLDRVIEEEAKHFENWRAQTDAISTALNGVRRDIGDLEAEITLGIAPSPTHASLGQRVGRGLIGHLVVGGRARRRNEADERLDGIHAALQALASSSRGAVRLLPEHNRAAQPTTDDAADEFVRVAGRGKSDSPTTGNMTGGDYSPRASHALPKTKKATPKHKRR